MKIGLIGVHGVGKTTTAKELRNLLGLPHEEIEVISRAHGLDPVSRQVKFFTDYTSRYIDVISENESVIVDSHPLIVVPYTDYWIGEVNGNREVARELVDSIISTLKHLPKLDALVEIRPSTPSTVIRRVKHRGRFNVREEENKEYIEYITSKIKYYVDKYGKLFSNKVIVVKAEIDPELRARSILVSLGF